MNMIEESVKSIEHRFRCLDYDDLLGTLHHLKILRSVYGKKDLTSHKISIMISHIEKYINSYEYVCPCCMWEELRTSLHRDSEKHNIDTCLLHIQQT